MPELRRGRRRLIRTIMLDIYILLVLQVSPDFERMHESVFGIFETLMTVLQFLMPVAAFAFFALFIIKLFFPFASADEDYDHQSEIAANRNAAPSSLRHGDLVQNIAGNALAEKGLKPSRMRKSESADSFCAYCQSGLSAGILRCPYCGASVKKS